MFNFANFGVKTLTTMKLMNSDHDAYCPSGDEIFNTDSDDDDFVAVTARKQHKKKVV